MADLVIPNDSTFMYEETDIIRSLGGEGGSGFGVHIKYDDLWFAMLYLAAIYVFGFVGQKYLLMPNLVGQIISGIILGPALLDIVPYPEAFVLFGEIGLVLLVIEAGVDIDVTTLKLIGVRGVIIATLGSIAPIAIGLAVAFAIGADTKAAIAAGAAFGPTSLGIAMNILRAAKIINTPTGQLIVAAAIIDDMIALIILSQLTGLVGEITLMGVLIPVISALGFLVIGGYLALMVLPDLFDKFIFKNVRKKNRGKIALFIMLAMVLGLMQATHYTKASHLMGAFIAGLTFCQDHYLHETFVSQFKRVLQWLMRIFFASTIGFQVPIKNFSSGKVIWQGLLFTTALLGKLGVGFLVPNFSKTKNFTGHHLRDCLLVGCSMAAEGEFAFVIAAYAVDKGLVDKDLYSSMVLAILLSTIIAPFSLRFTINYFAKRTMQDKFDQIQETLNDQDDEEIEAELKAGIRDGTTLFFCINTKSTVVWGILPRLIKALFKMDLDVIDHRSWVSRFGGTVMNEVYVRGPAGETDITTMIEKISKGTEEAINQPDSIISVTRWIPCIEDEEDENDRKTDIEFDRQSATGSARGSFTEQLMLEAKHSLDRSQHSIKDEYFTDDEEMPRNDSFVSSMKRALHVGGNSKNQDESHA